MTDSLAQTLRESVRAIVREELAAAMARPAPPVELLSVETFAERAGIGRTLAYDLIGRGDVRSVRIGRRRLVPADVVREIAEREL